MPGVDVGTPANNRVDPGRFDEGSREQIDGIGLTFPNRVDA